MSEVELPEGWDEALMSDVTADVPSEDPARDPDRVFAYIDISAIDNRRFAITSDEVKEFRGRDAPSRARRPVRPADVLYSNIRTYLRNIALVEAGVPADLCSTGFTVLRSNGVIEPEYLFRWVLTEEFLELISPHETGTHYPATSDRAVRALPIRVPPLAEQRRIVEKVEALLAQVNAARARLAKVPTILKRCRTPPPARGGFRPDGMWIRSPTRPFRKRKSPKDGSGANSKHWPFQNHRRFVPDHSARSSKRMTFATRVCRSSS